MHCMLRKIICQACNIYAGVAKGAGRSLAARLQSVKHSTGATGFTFAIQVLLILLPTLVMS